MPVALTISATGQPARPSDQGTIVISLGFSDHDGAAVVPNVGLTWSLTDEHGNVINERLDEPIAPASSVSIVVFGDDLKYSEGPKRVFTVEGTYNSTLGNNLPIREQREFSIENLVKAKTVV